MPIFNESEEWTLAADIAEVCLRLPDSTLEESMVKSIRHTATYLVGSMASLPSPTGKRPSHKFGTAYDELRRLDSNLAFAVRIGQLRNDDVAEIRTKIETLAAQVRAAAKAAEDAYKATLSKQNPFMDMSDMFGLDE